MVRCPPGDPPTTRFRPIGDGLIAITFRPAIMDAMTDPTIEQIPAATAVLARDGHRGLEVLLLRRAQTTSFAAGAWVFPGGRVDPGDCADDEVTSVAAARRAAVRETLEEAGIRVDGATLQVMSRWTPGPEAPKRFLTWILFGQAESDARATVDGSEIVDHRWITPGEALQEHRARQMLLLPPTWVTLDRLAAHRCCADAAADVRSGPVEHFESHLAATPAGRVVLWHGDSGYDTSDAGLPGPRHRLHLEKDGWRYERTR